MEKVFPMVSKIKHRENVPLVSLTKNYYLHYTCIMYYWWWFLYMLLLVLMKQIRREEKFMFSKLIKWKVGQSSFVFIESLLIHFNIHSWGINKKYAANTILYHKIGNIHSVSRW